MAQLCLNEHAEDTAPVVWFPKFVNAVRTVFACLIAVYSASAERVLSKLKIIKNRLRSTLADDYSSALMTLAA